MSSNTAPGDTRTGAGAALRIGAGLLAMIAYQILAHWAVTRGAPHGGVPLAVLAPIAVVALWAGFHRSAAAGLCVATALAGVALLAHRLPGAARALPLLPQLVICLGLAWMFGRTLLRGREPLVTRMARLVHGTLPARIVGYTRHVTLAWTLFLSAMAATSLLLFAFAPLRVWSLFANLLFLPLIVLMFLAEYVHRSLRYRWFAHATIWESLGAFRRLHAVAPTDSRVR
jgi:uncharacterized membrane protein